MAANNRQPPSFKTDVHRAPTKKWVNAKSYSYEGDDWGGYEDEYDAYDDPPPVPSKQTTGLRQPGQTLTASEATTHANEPSGSSASDTFIAPSQLQRSGSFEYGDDRRNFSAGAPPPESTHSPAFTDSSSGTKSATGLRRPSDTASASGASTTHTSFPRHSQEATPVGLPHQAASEASSSPPKPYLASHPQPQQPLEQIAASHHKSAYNAPPPSTTATNLFPARKSSLSQLRPTHLDTGRVDTGTGSTILYPPETMAAREGTTSSPAQSTAPRFVRPADIYKRIEEEKLRERQSIDSSRPSMESLGRPARPESAERTRTASGSPARHSAPLSTVPEARTQYHMQGFAVNDPHLAKAIGAQSPVKSSDDNMRAWESTIPVYTPTTPLYNTVPAMGTQLPAAVREEDEEEDPRTVPVTANIHMPAASSEAQPQAPFKGPSPILPALDRFSGFGSDFWDSSALDGPQASTNRGLDNAPPVNDNLRLDTHTDSQSQPSPGFRSAVQHAFAPSESLSPSRQDSQSSGYGSQLSTDASLSNISPIMSGVASGSHLERIGETSPRDDYLNEPQDAFAGTGHGRNVSGGSTVTLITSGHGRDIIPEAQGQSVAHRLDVVNDVEKPRSSSGTLGQISSAIEPSPSSAYGISGSADPTPTDSFSTGALSRAYTIEVPELGDEDTEGRDAADDDETPHLRQQPFSGAPSLAQLQPVTPDAFSRLTQSDARPESPSKGRVKDLANKYDEIHDTKSGSIASPTSSVSSWADSPKRSASPVKSVKGDPPSASDRAFQDHSSVEMQSSLAAPLERPHIPGAWVSYANSVRSGSGLSESDASVDLTETPKASRGRESLAHESDVVDPSTSLEAPAASQTATPTAEEVPDFSPNTNKPSILNDPLASLQQAGTALAASLMDTVGLGQSEADSDSREQTEDKSIAAEHDRSVGNIYAARPMGLDSTPFSAASSAAPTPPPKDTPLNERIAGQAPSNYFPTTLPVTQPQRLSPSRVDSTMSDSGPSENDRLHDDIVRSLGVSGDDSTNAQSEIPRAIPDSSLIPPSPTNDFHRESMGLPREYDSYWATTAGGGGGAGLSREASTIDSPGLPQQTIEPDETEGIALSDAPARPSLNHNRFSWEQESFRNALKESQSAGNTSVADSEDILSERNLASLNSRNNLTPDEESIASHPRDALFIDSARRGSDDAGQSVAARGVDHVPVTSFGAATEPIATGSANQTPEESESVKPLTGATSFVSTSGPQQSAGTSKLIPFQEIVSMKESHDRIRAFTSTRHEFASMDTGLDNWLSFMAASFPEHAQAVSSASKSTPPLPSSTRSKFGIIPGAKTPSSSQGTPYYQQYLNSAGSLPQPSSASFPAIPRGEGGVAVAAQPPPPAQNRSSSGQFGTKGMLQSASLGAKGLFAKGKNKLKGGDKVVE